MGNRFVLLAVTAWLFCSGILWGQTKELRTLDDSLSYAVGIDIAEKFKPLLPNFQAEALVAGMQDALTGPSGQMTPEEAQYFLMDYFSRRYPEINRQKAVAYLADVERTHPQVQKTASGLLYEIVEPGGGKPAGNSDRVLVHYTGKLSDGTEFDSSYERGEPILLPLDSVIDGWTEGLKLVGKGGKIRLWIPPELGYGERGGGSVIPPNEALYFEVEMIDINPE